MGIGAYLSRFLKDQSVLPGFIGVEILLGFIGAFSVPLCYFFFAFVDSSGYQFFVLSLVTIIGTLTGFEIPLLTRILNTEGSFEENISDILTFDYLGALGATLLFPFFLLPFIGLYRSSLIFGFINILVALTTLQFFRNVVNISSKKRLLLFLSNLAVALVILFMLIQAKKHLRNWDELIFKYPIIHSENSIYQKIDITQSNSEFRLYLNGAIQFSSRDEYRYHEALVHVPLSQVENPRRILVLGGGEGLVAREILKYEEVEKIVIVDIDPAITELSKKNALIANLNGNALDNPKVEVRNEDAFVFLHSDSVKYDAIIIDLPDPSNESLARLYSDVFYNLCRGLLDADGVVATQATSPHLSTNAFWCINETMRHAGFSYTYPYSVYVPSFGEWGFIMGKLDPSFNSEFKEDIEYAYLEDALFDHMFYFTKDIRSYEGGVNRLDSPILLDYYLDHWKSLQGEKR